jgi:hypothetical protein
MLKHIFISLFVLLSATSTLYLIPSFNFEYNEERYVFENYPSPFDSGYINLDFNLPLALNRYKTTIESVNAIEDRNELNKLVARDRDILSKRLQFVFGQNYELVTITRDNKVRFEVYTQDKIFSPDILTNSNEVFEVSKTATSAEVTLDNESQSTPEREIIKLNRTDFGFADIASINSAEGVKYIIRMPLSLLLGPDKLKLINDNIFSELSITTANDEYQARLEYSQTFVATHLTITGIGSLAEARYLQAMLNTEPYSLSYNSSQNLYLSTNRNQIIALISLISIFIVAGMVVAYLYKLKISLNKTLIGFGLTIVFFASLKFFAIGVSLAIILTSLILLLFTILSTKQAFYYIFLIALLVLSLLGFLPGMGISIPTMIIITVYGFFMYLTNYIFLQSKS